MIDENNIDVDWQETRRFLEEKYFSKIRELSKKYDYPCENIAIDFNWVFGLIEKIEQQPQADKWIPCSERLPSESNYYMACIYDEDVDDFDFRKTWFAHVDDYDMEESEWRELYGFEEVIAWKPLPTPYKKEGAE